MRVIRKMFIWLIVLLCAAMIGTHFAVRSSWGKGVIEDHVSLLTGMKVSIEKTGLDFTFALVLSDVNMTDNHTGYKVFSAPKIKVSYCGAKKKVKIIRPEIFAFSTESGSWTPSVMRHLENDDVPLSVQFNNMFVSMKPKFNFEVIDGVVGLKAKVDGKDETVKQFTSVYWGCQSVNLKRRSGLIYNSLSIQKINNSNVEFGCDWFSDGRDMYAMSDSCKMNFKSSDNKGALGNDENCEKKAELVEKTEPVE